MTICSKTSKLTAALPVFATLPEARGSADHGVNPAAAHPLQLSGHELAHHPAPVAADRNRGRFWALSPLRFTSDVTVRLELEGVSRGGGLNRLQSL